MIGFALLNGSAGLRLSGVTVPSLVGIANAAPLPGTLGADGVQAITTYQDAGGYSPDNIVIYAGYPTRWTIAVVDHEHLRRVAVGPGRRHPGAAREGRQHLRAAGPAAGTLNYTCAMGMYSGKITVVDAPADAAAVVTPAAATPAPASATTAAHRPSASPATGRRQHPRPAFPPCRSCGPTRTKAATARPTPRSPPASRRGGTSTPARRSTGAPPTSSCRASGSRSYLTPGDERHRPARPQAGKLDYTCAMGMYWGSIAIVEPATSLTSVGG